MLATKHLAGHLVKLDIATQPSEFMVISYVSWKDVG